MADNLNIIGEPIFDDCIIKIETHTYNPYVNTTFEQWWDAHTAVGFVHVVMWYFLYIEERLKED